MIAGVATETIVESTRIMKKPRQRAKSAGHGSFSSTAGAAGEGWVMTQANTRTGTMHSVTHQDLMAGPPPTHLPVDPAQAELDAGHAARRRRTPPPGVAGRLGCAAGRWPQQKRPTRDGLRLRAGRLPPQPRPAAPQRLEGPRPGARGSTSPTAASSAAWPCSPSRAGAIGETDEWERCSAFLRDSSPTAYDGSCCGDERDRPQAARRRSAATAPGPRRGPGTASAAAGRGRRRPAGCRAA